MSVLLQQILYGIKNEYRFNAIIQNLSLRELSASVRILCANVHPVSSVAVVTDWLLKDQRELAALSRNGADEDVAVVLEHDLACQCKSDSGASLFGREEWDEYALLYFRLYACPVVGDSDEGLACRIDSGGEANAACAVFSRVADEVDEYLFDLAFVGDYGQPCWRDCHADVPAGVADEGRDVPGESGRVYALQDRLGEV